MSPSEFTTDSQLVAAVCNNDLAAIEHFLDSCCAPVVLGLSRRFSRYEYGDLLNDLAIHLFEGDWRRLRTWQGRSTLRAWVRQVAARLCLHHCRNLQRDPRKEPLTDATAQTDDDPLTELGLQESRVEVLRAIERLDDPVDRVILLMRFFEDATAAQIAETLDITPEYARVRLHRALNRVREMIEGGLCDA
jgi:RNA polymerase sigma factor (sigma-70 family)